MRDAFMLKISCGWREAMEVSGMFLVFFHVLRLLPIRFTLQNLCGVRKSRIKHQPPKNSWFEDWICLYLVMVI